MDRIDKALLILPFLPVADLSSTLFSLNFGGEEVGILARPVLQNYGPGGLVMLAISASVIFLVSMRVVIHIKILFIKEWKFKWMWYVLAIQICWFLVLEAVYFSTVIMNFLVPLAPFLTQTVTLKAVLFCAYFAFITALTIPKIRQMPHFYNVQNTDN